MPNDSYRLFFCAGCGRQVSICASCDRGNRYCPDSDCFESHRRHAKRRYRADYQRTRKGRLSHASAQQRYRLRLCEQKVTDHPSPELASPAMVELIQRPEEVPTDVHPELVPPAPTRCDFCGASCGPLMHRWTGCW